MRDVVISGGGRGGDKGWRRVVIRVRWEGGDKGDEMRWG